MCRLSIGVGNLIWGVWHPFFNPNPVQQLSINEDRAKSESNTYRFGAHISPTAQSDLLGSFMYIDQSVTDYSSGDNTVPAEKIRR